MCHLFTRKCFFVTSASLFYASFITPICKKKYLSKTQVVGPMLGWSWPIVHDAGPTSARGKYIGNVNTYTYIHTYIHVCIEIEGDFMHIEYFDRVKAFHTIFSRSSYETRSLVIHQVWGCCLNGKSDFTNSCPSPVVCSLGPSSFQKTVLWTDIQHISYTHVQ